MQTQIRWRDDAGAEGDSEFLNLLLEGSRLLQQGEVQSARGRLEQALRLRPQNEKARNLLGQTYFKMGMYDAARRLYTQLVGEYPDEPTLRLNLALVFIKKGEMPAARDELERVYELRPDHQKALNYLGLVYERMDLLALARWAFRQAGSDKLASEMEGKLRAKGLPLEADKVPQPRSTPPPALEEPPAEVQLSKLPAAVTQPPISVVEEPAPQPVVADPPPPEPEQAVTQDTAPELAPPPAPPPPPSSAAAAMPHLFRAMAVETAMAASEPTNPAPPKAMGAARTSLDWTPSATNDSMLMALSGDAMTGEQWVQRRGLPTVTRPFSPMTAGLLGLAVDGPVLVRALTIVATQGEVWMEPVTRAGQDAPVGGEEDPLLLASGPGLLTLDPGDHRVAVLKLDNSEATVIEQALFGTSSGVNRQDGVLGASGAFAGLPCMRFTGVGVVAVRSPASVRAVPVAPNQPFTVSLLHLLAFEGSLVCNVAPAIPGLQLPAFRRSVTLQGTGVALLRAGSRP